MTIARRLLLMSAASAAVTAALALASADAVSALVRTDPAQWGRAELSAALVAAMSGIGSLGAAWHLLSAVVALAATRRPRARLARTALERWGAPLVRRIAVGALLAGVAAAPAAAAPAPGPDAPDLGWQPTSGQAESSAASTAPADPGGPESPAQGPPVPSPETSPGADSPSSPSTARGTAPVPGPSGAGGAAGGEKARDPGASSPDQGADGAPRRTEGGVAPPAAGSRESLVVEPGQSLWSISAARLGPQASTADIARAWRSLYHANEGAIGPEPGLIHPGLRLTVPEDLAPPPQGS